MFYSQPLCNACRDSTHSAKMFAKHDVVDILSKKSNTQRHCEVHNEPFIMYNVDDKVYSGVDLIIKLI